MKAIEKDDLDAVSAILEKAPNLLNSQDPSQQFRHTPIVRATFFQRIEIVKYLLTLDPDVFIECGKSGNAYR